jgi:hypothetical protein
LVFNFSVRSSAAIAAAGSEGSELISGAYLTSDSTS